MEFYDPMLYLSTPEHPNMMGVIVGLKEDIDGDILKEAVEGLRDRFPYFYVKAESEENDLAAVPNPLPMVVRNTWDPVCLNSEESNFHLAAFKYSGRRLAFELSHAISDGAGVLPYVKSVMYMYLSKKTGQAFDPEGFRLPGSAIPESETGNPFAGLDIDSAEEPLYIKPPVTDFYRLTDDNDNEQRIFFLKIPESDLMQYCRDTDGSPNVFFSVMLAKAVRRYDPESDKTVSVSVAVDNKAILGNHDNYRMFANVAELDFPKKRSLDDVTKSCTIARGQLMLQTQKENSLRTIRQRKATFSQLGMMPLDMKLNMIGKAAGSLRWSASVSYANSRSFGPLDPFIDELYVVAEPGTSGVICEIACINHSFFLAFSQAFSSDRFFKAFIEELALTGIEYSVLADEPLRMCSIERFS